MKDLFFVMGMGRSGTTALTELLGTHSDIAIGMERYKGLWRGSMNQINPSLFEQSRFFDFEDGLTNVVPTDPRWTSFYEAQRSKWESARYVGDKITSVQPRKLWENCPRAKILFIVRDVGSVAHSWDARARQSDDVWSPKQDAERAIRQWNRMSQRVVKSVRDRPDLARVVEYERFFGSTDLSVIDAVARWLDIELEPTVVARYDAMRLEFQDTIRDKDRTLTESAQRFLLETHDRAVWRQLSEVSI